MGRAYLGPKDKADARRQAAFDELWGTIEKYHSMMSYERRDFLAVAGVTPGKFYARKKEPEKMQMGELIKLIGTLKIPYQEIEPMMKKILGY